MKQDEKNKAYFQETFQEVHAPEGLGRKVKNMTKTEAKKKGMAAVKKLAVAAAIAAVLFAGSNGVAYAMTGSTWLETVMAKLYVNGVAYDMEMTGEELEDGTVQYSGTVEVPDGSSGSVVILTDEDFVTQEYYVAMDTTTEPERTEVVEENGRTYLVAGELKLDITEDVADGHAAGSYEKEGVLYRYEVKEDIEAPGCFELHISSEE